MTGRSEYEEHLMFSLRGLQMVVQEADVNMFQCIVTFAAGGPSMSESMFISYMTPVGITPVLMKKALAHFEGMDLFKIVCDCKDKTTCLVKDLHEQEWYIAGQKELTEQSERYIITRDSIEDLRIALQL